MALRGSSGPPASMQEDESARDVALGDHPRRGRPGLDRRGHLGGDRHRLPPGLPPDILDRFPFQPCAAFEQTSPVSTQPLVTRVRGEPVMRLSNARKLAGLPAVHVGYKYV